MDGDVLLHIYNLKKKLGRIHDNKFLMMEVILYQEGDAFCS